MKQYPTAKDYMDVLQHPRQAFTVPELQSAVLATDMGLPYPVPGRSAAVFQATIGQQDYALRCYLRDEASNQGRYAALSRFVVSTPALGIPVGTVKWHEAAIRAIGDTWPVLQMEWIDGDLIGDYVGYLADQDERQALGSLARRWRAFVGELQQAEFAHGDLQHRNIIVDRQHRLRLVDFDGVWCPPLRGQAPPTERGHDNFQPPGRTAAGRWGPKMDTFSALVIYLALTALSFDTALWAPLNDGENLLFTSKDFSSPFNTKVWDLLGRLSNETVDRLAHLLQDSCVPTGAGNKALADLVTPGWWERQSKVPVPRPGQTRSRPRPSNVTGSTTWYSQPLPAAPTGGYQSPVAKPVPVPAKPGRPAGAGGNWWEASARTPSPLPARTSSARTSSARPATTTPSSGWVSTPRPSPKPAPTPRRPPAKKNVRHPFRSAGVLFITVLGAGTAALLGAHPWIHPPVLQPTGLAAGSAATASLSIHWSGPHTGPVPDEYEILRDGHEVGTVPGSTTRYIDKGLAPATAYTYRVMAVRGGKVSPASAILSARTATPPVSAGIMDWNGTVDYTITNLSNIDWSESKTWTDLWTFTPACQTTSCAINLSGAFEGYGFTTTLEPSSTPGTYTGTAPLNNYFNCESYDSDSMLTITVTVTGADVSNSQWVANSFDGTVDVAVAANSSGGCDPASAEAQVNSA